MDEAAFRQKLSEMLERPCSFEKAVLGRCVSCRQSQKFQIAEREAVTCKNPASLSRCVSLHGLLRHNFSFALGKVHDEKILTYAQEMQVQCGGLKGLQYVLDDGAEVDDVEELLDDVLQKWGEFAEIPFSEVVHAAALIYKGRRG